MIQRSKALRMSLVVPLVATASVVFAFAVWGQARGVGALAGALLSVVNWLALSWFVGRIAAGGTSQPGLMLALVAKIGLLTAAVFVLITKLALDPLGVLIGLSTLFLAPVLGGLMRSPAYGPTAAPSAQSSVQEER